MPFSAPGFDPVHGASRNLIPKAASSVPISRLMLGDIVLASTTTVPGLALFAMPFSPVITLRDMSESPTQRKMQSDCAPTSAGVAQTTPSPFFAISVAFAAVCDQRAT